MQLDPVVDPVVDTWLCTLAVNGRRPATLTSYEYATRRLLEFHGRQLATVGRAEALAFVTHLRERHRPGGVASIVRSLRAFYSWCIAEGLATANPFARLQVKVPKSLHATPAEADIDAVLRHAVRHRRDFALLAVLADTGCRKGEIAALTPTDISLASGVVRFPVSKTEPRTVPLSDRAHRALESHLRALGSSRLGLWASSDPYSLVAAVVRRHSEGQLTPHAFRRAFAVRWLAGGGSELGLMRVAGWSNREMISLYTAARADELAHAEMRRLQGG